MAAPPARAVGDCSPARFIQAYENAFALAGKGRHGAALAVWKGLAEQGFAPAQSQLGRLYAAGKGTGRDAVKALLWLTLAERAGEFHALKARRAIAKGMKAATKSRAAALIEKWTPEIDPCLRASLADEAERDLGAGEQRRLDGAAFAGGIGRKFKDITILAEDGRAYAGTKKAIGMIAKFRPHQVPYFQVLDSVVVGRGEPIIRGEPVAPLDGTRSAAVRVFIPAAYVTVGEVAKAAPSILSQTMAQVYKTLDGVAATDRYAVVYRGIRVSGSRHPDVNNKPFFKEVSRALDLAEKLSPGLRRNVRRITDIHYDPPSRYVGPRINALAVYVHSSVPDKRRMVIVPRDLKYSGAAAILLTTLVHEGTHADQDLRIHYKRLEVAALKIQRTKVGAGSGKGKKLTRKIAALEKDVALWDAEGEAHVKAFECEAAVNEIKAQIEMGIGRSTGATYGTICPEVESLSWKRKDNRLTP